MHPRPRDAPNDLGRMTWTEVSAERAIVVVPVGSCEQHGPHLPLDTDTAIAVTLAQALVRVRPDCVVAPPVAISASGEHQGFPGTLSIGTEITAGVLIELARSADWAAGVVFVNGHGGNSTAIRRATDVFEHEHRRVLTWWPEIDDGDPHAGRTETSLMLAIDPDRVRLDAAESGPVPSFAELVNHGVMPLSPNGVLGDPDGANASEGSDLLRQLTRRLVEAVDGAVARWTAA